MAYRYGVGLATAVLAGLVSPATAMAAGVDGWFIGGSAGYSRMKPRVKDVDISALNYSEKNRGTGFKMSGGYQFNRTWALEAQYIDLGKYEAHATDDSGAYGAVRIRAVALGAVGTLPLDERFAVLGKLGVVRGRADAEGINSSRHTRFSATRTAPLMGVGTEFRVTPQLALRLEYEFYGEPEFFTAGDTSMTIRSEMLSLGLQYRF